jgi:hypothetical protein
MLPVTAAIPVATQRAPTETVSVERTIKPAQAPTETVTVERFVTRVAKKEPLAASGAGERHASIADAIFIALFFFIRYLEDQAQGEGAHQRQGPLCQCASPSLL